MIFKKHSYINNYLVKKLSEIKRKKYVLSEDITIISSDCSGGILYSNYSCKFNSPFINLFIYPEDFLELIFKFENINLKNIKFIKFHKSKYFGTSINFSINNYPIAQIVGTTIELHFMHDKNDQNAHISWIKRCDRINYNKLIFILNDRRKISYETLNKINNFKKNNLFYFTCDINCEIKNSIYIPSHTSFLEWDWINKLEYYISRRRFDEIFNPVC